MAICTDHCAAIRRVLEAGQVGEVYNVGGWNEMANIDVVKTLCRILDAKNRDQMANRMPSKLALWKTGRVTINATPLMPASCTKNWAGSQQKVLTLG